MLRRFNVVTVCKVQKDYLFNFKPLFVISCYHYHSRGMITPGFLFNRSTFARIPRLLYDKIPPHPPPQINWSHEFSRSLLLPSLRFLLHHSDHVFCRPKNGSKDLQKSILQALCPALYHFHCKTESNVCDFGLQQLRNSVLYWLRQTYNIWNLKLESESVNESCFYYNEYLSRVVFDSDSVKFSILMYRIIEFCDLCVPTCMARGVGPPSDKKEVAVLGTQFSKIKFCYATQ